MQAKSPELVCSVNNYTITVKLNGDRLAVRAFSESLVKLFTGEFSVSSLPQDIQSLGNCEVVFESIQESLNQKQKITLTDTGLLKFPFQVKLGKITLKKTIPFALKEVEFDENQKLNVKIERLEKELRKQAAEIQSLKKELHPEYNKGVFDFDNTTPYYNRFNIKDRNVSLNCSNSNNYFPLFSKNRIQNIQKFDFEVIHQGHSYHMIGIASGEVKNNTQIYSSGSAISLYSNSNAYICGSGEQVSFNSMMRTGNKLSMIVDLKNFTVQWTSMGFVTPKITIPESLRDKQLFPFIEYYDYSNNQVQIKVL